MSSPYSCGSLRSASSGRHSHRDTPHSNVHGAHFAAPARHDASSLPLTAEQLASLPHGSTIQFNFFNGQGLQYFGGHHSPAHLPSHGCGAGMQEPSRSASDFFARLVLSSYAPPPPPPLLGTHGASHASFSTCDDKRAVARVRFLQSELDACTSRFLQPLGFESIQEMVRILGGDQGATWISEFVRGALSYQCQCREGQAVRHVSSQQLHRHHHTGTRPPQPQDSMGYGSSDDLSSSCSAQTSVRSAGTLPSTPSSSSCAAPHDVRFSPLWGFLAHKGASCPQPTPPPHVPSLSGGQHNNGHIFFAPPPQAHEPSRSTHQSRVQRDAPSCASQRSKRFDYDQLTIRGRRKRISTARSGLCDFLDKTAPSLGLDISNSSIPVGQSRARCLQVCAVRY